MIAIIGTSDWPCWLAEACKILLLHLKQFSTVQRDAYGSPDQHTMVQ